ncbi:MAG: hypothetical protein CMI26_11095 [Opitutae bacterium]|nr:hypothetical protein [Opitutae bacterium]|tara:strand:+ start:521 stop:991 length:471 start_codon:yes stop_codon:yes gene_type:complete
MALYLCAENKILSRDFLLKQGKCCGSGCQMCPYEPKHQKNAQKKKTSHQQENSYTIIIPEELKNKTCDPIQLDPKGYFLIKIEDGKICIAHCHYQNKRGWYENKIKSTFNSKDPVEILRWAKKENLISLDEHYQYLDKEMKHAVKALKNNTKYIQE